MARLPKSVKILNPIFTISNTIRNLGQNGEIAKMAKNFEPYIYNIWKQLKGNETNHFGHFLIKLNLTVVL